MKKGFTLIEVMVVAVIVAILAAVAIPAYQGYITSSSERVCKNMASTIAASAAALVSDQGNVAAGDIEALKAFTTTEGNTDVVSAVSVTVTTSQTGLITVTPARDGASAQSTSY